jgi:serine/threonine protein kinase
LILNKRQILRLQKEGRIHWFDQKNKILYKIYKNDNLLDGSESLNTRLTQIVELSSSMEFIPKITYSYEEDFLIMRQNKLVKDSQLDQIEPFEKKLTLIKQFSKSLDMLHAKGFVHGDINRKNIIFSNDRLCLIDFEPSLLQFKNYAKQWMSTRPYIHSDDIKNKCITINSDLLGFSCFVNWFFLFDNPPQYYSDECSKIINESKLGLNPFENLVDILLERIINIKPPVINQDEIQKHIEHVVWSYGESLDNWNYSDYLEPKSQLTKIPKKN